MQSLLSNKELFEELESSKINMISEISKKKYIKLLKERLISSWEEMYEEDFHLHKVLLDGPKPFMGFLESTFDVNLANRIRIALMSIFIHTQLRNESELYSVWKSEMNKVYRHANMEHCEKNMPSEKDKKALIVDSGIESEKKYIDQDLVRKIYNGLEDGKDDKLYLAFMGAAGLPPLRSTDCYRVHLVHGESEVPNYIDFSTYPYTLVLREYKTSKLYKKKDIELTPEICKQVDISLQKHPREYLFLNPKTGEIFNSRGQFGKYSIFLLRKHFGENFQGGRLLRHTYVSDSSLNFNQKTNAERAKIAYVMGNSEPTIQFNYLYRDQEEWDEEETESTKTPKTSLNNTIENKIPNSELSFQDIKEAHHHIDIIKNNLTKLTPHIFIVIKSFLDVPRCILPLNNKGSNIPLVAFWKSKVVDKFNKEQFQDYNSIIEVKDSSSDTIKLYMNDEKYGVCEYEFEDEEVKKLLKRDDVLFNYSNLQYYYKTMVDIFRNTNLFPDLPQTYSMKYFQKDIELKKLMDKDEVEKKAKKTKKKRKKKNKNI
tara:strand:- start:355 stop:1983 length:1629 start_codon:yes stop_codon:yes gene_type:complete